MTIDPLTIPCAYCCESGEITAPERMSMENRIVCRRCKIVLRPADWITGGINALVGKLTKRDVFFFNVFNGWEWVKASQEERVDGGTFESFEACVLDAWEKSKMGEEEKDDYSVLP